MKEALAKLRELVGTAVSATLLVLVILVAGILRIDLEQGTNNSDRKD